MKKRPLDVDFGEDEILAKLNLLLHRSQVYMRPLVTNNFRFMMFPFYALAVKLQTEFRLI